MRRCPRLPQTRCIFRHFPASASSVPSPCVLWKREKQPLRLSYLFSWTTLLLRMNRLPVHLPHPVCEVPPERILRLLSYEEENDRQTNFSEIHPLRRVNSPLYSTRPAPPAARVPHRIPAESSRRSLHLLCYYRYTYYILICRPVSDRAKYPQ